MNPLTLRDYIAIEDTDHNDEVNKFYMRYKIVTEEDEQYYRPKKVRVEYLFFNRYASRKRKTT